MATIEETLDKAIEVAVKRATAAAKTAILATHPVGSLYLTVGSENPSTVLGGGTWTKVGTGRCLWGADSSHAAGSEISAGLPNITGTWYTTWNNAVRGFHGLTATGCFYRKTDTSKPGRITAEDGRAGNSSTNGYPWFDASKSNSIYGSSTTVQPPALVVNIWKRTA